MSALIGWAHSPFGKLDDETVESLITRTALAAVADAGCDPVDIDAVFLAHFGDGFSEQAFTGPLITLADPAWRHVPVTRLENACATGSAALNAGLDFLAAGRGRHVLVVGVEKMTHLGAAEIGRLLLKACYRAEEAEIQGGFAGVFAQIARDYFAAYGDQSAALARIAAKNHRNGARNPWAQMRRDLGFEFCNTVSDKNPLVAPPLRRTDCSLVSDGAAAVVIAADGAAATKAVSVRARAQASDLYPMSRRDMTRFVGAQTAWSRALADAGIGVWDLDLVETHDCFTIAELIEYEAMGLAPAGQGARVALDGVTEADGRLPVNLSGGLKAKGHPIGATGVSMHVMVARQLAGEGGEMQRPGARLGGVFNMGGAAVANYVTILEARD